MHALAVQCSAGGGRAAGEAWGIRDQAPPVPPARRIWSALKSTRKRAMWSGLARGLRGPLGKRRKPRAPAGGRQMRPAQRNRAWSTERQPAHAFWSANLTTRRLLGPTWRPLKALMAVAACRERRVWRTEAGVQSEGPAGLRAQLQPRQQAWHSMQPAQQRQRQRQQQQQRRRLGHTCWRVA